MKRAAIISLKLAASLPLAIILGVLAAGTIETGLWPLLFLSDTWIAAFDTLTVSVCEIGAFAALVWYWALGR